MNVRVAATHVITAILQDEGSLSSLLPHYATKVEDRDRGLMQQLCYGTLRYYPRLSAYLNLLLAKPFKDKDKDLEAVLACSLYQLLETRIPPHAAVNEAVATCKALKKPWAKGLVNAVLRRFLRERIELDSALEKDQAFKTAHPNWLVELWREAWPDQLDAIIEANNAHPPMTLRVNQSRSNQTQYLKQLTCAPGGKTCHILELLRSTGEQSSDVVALDISAKRLERVEENLERLSLQATLISADAADTNTWWDGQHFDRILLDAPCSATGVIRRHPDVKLLRKPADIAKLASLQLTLLNALWPLLKEDGILLYATCSTLPQENDEVVLNFVRTASNATVEKLHLEAGLETPAGRQLLPLIGGHDGFYYAQLRKTSLH